MKISTWKFWLIPTLIVLILAIYPQINLWLAKGSAWRGAYAVSNYDEPAYSAYVNSLINGRPRKNDPFVGADDSPEYSQSESLYSIQFIPPYAIALPARMFGWSASTAFIILNFLIAIFSALAIFALLREITKDDLLSAVGVLTVLCLGTAIAFQGTLQRFVTGVNLTEFFPFLRRYQPGFAFPVFFIFCLMVWRMLAAETNRKAILYTIASGATLVVLIFSYFYLWTTAIAWLGCLIFLWLVFRTEEQMKTLLKAAGVGAFGLGALIPYFIMLSNRAANTDDTQLLTFTRMPNLFAPPEIVGLLIAVAVFYLAWRGTFKLAAPKVLFTFSIALTPFVVLNQQIITGRSLQPIHYEIFIANYLSLVALTLFIWLMLRLYDEKELAPKLRRAIFYLGVFAAVWGIVESTTSTSRSAGYESLRDEAIPALAYLHEQETSEKPIEGKQKYATVFSQNLMVAEFIPTMTSYRPLWNPHSNSAGGISLAENKEVFYRYLYYSGFDEKDLAKALDERVFEVVAALFGAERALPALASEAKPVTRQEAQTEIKNYSQFVANFNREKAAAPALSYVIVPTKAEPNYKNLDLWYERDAGQEFGLFKVYKVKLKS